MFFSVIFAESMFPNFPASLLIPNSGSVHAAVTIPGSKSYSNRALLLALLAKGQSCLTNFLSSEDTAVLLHLFKQWQVEFQLQNDVLQITGIGADIPAYDQRIELENAGTAVRFLTAILTLGQGTYCIDGNRRMRVRPIKDLLDALRSVGCKVQGSVQTDFLPLQIVGGGFPGGQMHVWGENSSQYVSALLMVAPYARADTRLHVSGKLVSHTYVDMTLQAMADFGVKAEKIGQQSYFVPAFQAYQPRRYEIEADASSASYFFALPAIVGGQITVQNATKNSLQGDYFLLDVLEKMGCRVHWSEQGVTVQNDCVLQAAGAVDMNSSSDVALTLAVVALFAHGETVIYNVANMRLKECDRLNALCTELNKLGLPITQRPDGWTIYGIGKKGAKLPHPIDVPVSEQALNTYQDHRMAMSISLVGLRAAQLTLDNPQCVIKTFPTFFQKLFSVITPLS